MPARVPRCHHPWQQMVIDSTGVVAPCCYWGAIDSRNEAIGDLNVSSIEEIWNGPGFQKLRAGMASGDLAAAGCSNCQAVRQGMGLGFEYDSDCEQEIADQTPYARNIEILKKEIADGATVLQAKPTIVSFTPSHRCNIRCTHCYQEPTRTSEIGRKRAEDEVAALAPYLVRLVAGGGEPLLLPIWIKFLNEYELSQNPYLDFSTSTNATVVTDTVATGLRRFKKVTLNVSLDGTEESYERVRVGAKFPQVRDNIRRLKQIAEAARNRQSALGVSMCVMKSDILDLPNFVRFCTDEALSFGISPVATFPPEESLRCFNDPPREMAGWAAAIDEAEKLVATVYLPRMAKLRKAPMSHPMEHEFWRNNFRLLRDSIPLELAGRRHYRTTVVLPPGLLAILPDPQRTAPVKYASISRVGEKRGVQYWALLQGSQFEVSLLPGDYWIRIHDGPFVSWVPADIEPETGSSWAGVFRIGVGPPTSVRLPAGLFRRFPDLAPGGKGMKAYVFRLGQADGPICSGIARDGKLDVCLPAGDYAVNFPQIDGVTPSYWDVVRFRIEPDREAVTARYLPITARRVKGRIRRTLNALRTRANFASA